MAITGQDVLTQMNKVTMPQLLVGLAVIAAGLTAANFLLEIQPTWEEIARKQTEQVRLEKDLIDKQSIANNLAQYKHEKEVLERRLAQALTELPNEANIDDLIRSLSEIGQKSGLTINMIEPHAESVKPLYAEIPIIMGVTGSYHEIGVFLDSVAKLARIVNVTGIKMSAPHVVNDKLTVTASYVATTFRSTSEGAKK